MPTDRVNRRATVLLAPIAAGLTYWIVVVTPTHIQFRRHTAGSLSTADSYRTTFERTERTRRRAH